MESDICAEARELRVAAACSAMPGILRPTVAPTGAVLTAWRATSRFKGGVRPKAGHRVTGLAMQHQDVRTAGVGGYDVTDQFFISTRTGPPPCSRPV